jgi:anti-sigma factor RsiW
MRRPAPPPNLAKECGSLLGKLHALSARTDAAERKILERALQRDEEARQRMEELRHQVLTTPGASREYQVLALELRRIALVIQMARQHLGVRSANGTRPR